MKKTVFSVLLASAALAMTGCVSNSVDISASRLRIRSFVDGCDIVKVQGDKVWFEHQAYALPGQWMGFNEPTFVNGQRWQPTWTGSDSDKFTADAALPAREFTADTLKVVSNTGLGRATVAEYPSKANGYTLAITLDDRNAQGASWYEVGIDWED